MSASLPKRRTKPICKSLPLFFAASHISCASKRFIAMGFSQMTFTPAFSAATVGALWAAFQVQTETASSFSFASISSNFSYTRASGTPSRTPKRFAFSTSRSHSATTSTSGCALYPAIWNSAIPPVPMIPTLNFAIKTPPALFLCHIIAPQEAFRQEFSKICCFTRRDIV